jgi:hypothetical protein
MTYLAFQENNLGGTIPSEVSQISKNLETLVLYENYLVGRTHPSEIGLLIKLAMLF